MEKKVDQKLLDMIIVFNETKNQDERDTQFQKIANYIMKKHNVTYEQFMETFSEMLNQ